MRTLISVCTVYKIRRTIRTNCHTNTVVTICNWSNDVDPYAIHNNHHGDIKTDMCYCSNWSGVGINSARKCASRRKKIIQMAKRLWTKMIFEMSNKNVYYAWRVRWAGCVAFVEWKSTNCPCLYCLRDKTSVKNLSNEYGEWDKIKMAE